MTLRRLSAVLILAIPLVGFVWVVGTVGFADSTVGVEAPRYLDIKARELSTLDKEQLAKALASSVEKANQINNLWQNAKANYEHLLYVLLGIIAVLSIALAFLLWQMPPNSTIEMDARKSGARPSL